MITFGSKLQHLPPSDCLTPDMGTRDEPPDEPPRFVWASEDEDSEDEDDGPSLAQMRARWEDDAEAEARGGSTKKRRKKETRRRAARYDHVYPPGDSRRRTLDSSRSPWFELIEHPEVRVPGSWAFNKFRKTFRVPMPVVDKLMAAAQRKPEWADKPAGQGNGRGPARHPLILKVLAALKFLAKDHDPDDLEQVARISTTTLRRFIVEFVTWLGTEQYAIHVGLPDAEKLRASLSVYEKLGFPGAYCETDGVHVEWNNCPAKWRIECTGKEGYPTIAFNVSILHNKEIIHGTSWTGGATNDQTQARYDELFQKLRWDQEKLAPNELLKYKLLDEKGELVEWIGLYAIVDGGYFAWRCLQAPLRDAAGDDGARWSERLESVRKSVEMTFGIMKKRFKVLRNAMLFRDPKYIEKVFRACCTLHNLLLRYDRLDTMGQRGQDWVKSKEVIRARDDTEGSRGRHVVRGPRNRSKAAGGMEQGHINLREALITHYAQKRKLEAVEWLRTAAEVRPRAGREEDEEGEEEEEEEEEYMFGNTSDEDDF